jgi:hypothetical protein
MHFSWTGFWVAPLVVPLIGSAVMSPLLSGEGPAILTLAILLIPACMISYGTMVFLFLPALFLLSLLRPVTGWIACALGFALGAAMILPVTMLAWKGSGPDSGPPVENFLTFFARWAFDPFMLFFPLAGLVTAWLYWWLGTRRLKLRAAKPATMKA